MRVSDDLFKLIKSLSPSEKRYLKVYYLNQGNGKQNNYKLLFDAIDEQEEYDEEAIRKQFKGQTFAKQLHVTKNYLYNNILKFLRHYQNKPNTDLKLCQMYEDICILEEKGLYNQALKLLRRGREIAREYERFPMLIKLISKEYEIAFEGNDKHVVFEEYTRELLNQEADAVQKLTEITNFWRFSTETYLHNQTHSDPQNFVKSEEGRRLKAIVDETAARDPQSFTAKLFQHRLLTLWAISSGQYDQAYNNQEQSVKHYEDHPEMVAEQPSHYINELANLAVMEVDKKNYDRILQLVDKIENAHFDYQFSESPALQQKIFVSTSLLSLIAHIYKGNFDDAYSLSEKVYDGLSRWADDINKEHEINLVYLLAYACFGAGQLQESLDLLNRIINEQRLKLRSDLQGYARLINLIIHFELGHDTIAPYLVKSTRRFFQTKHRLNKTSKLVLDSFTKLAKADSDKKKQEVLTKLHKQLQEVSQLPEEQMVFKYFDFLSWVEAKLHGRPFDHVHAQRVQAGEILA